MEGEKPERRKATIEELDRLLGMEDMEIDILPDGSIFAREKMSNHPKPVTLREKIGGEYAAW